MISHQHRCIFTHVPKTAGKAVLSAFGLPMLNRDYDGSLQHIVNPYGHERLSRYRGCPEFRYFKFAFVRNPWDRLVSAFFYLDAGGCNEFDERFRATHLARYGGDFAAFVGDFGQHVGAQHFRPQTDWLCDAAGSLLPDFVGRFEAIDRDFAIVAQRLSVPARLPALNGSVHRPYREHYDAVAREIVARTYRSDIEAFGYEF
jgi:hypothetical protein